MSVSLDRAPKPGDFRASRHHDRLRVSLARLKAPRLNSVTDAEQAVALSERALYDAAATHQRNLARLARARKEMGVPTLDKVPSAEVLAAGHASLSGRLIGRVIRRDRLTDDSKTAGTLRLESGETVKWTAGSAYVDALDVLFDGAPISLRGPLMDDGTLSIMEVQPAPREFWHDAEDYETAAQLGPMTVMAISLLKRDLIAAHGAHCKKCGKGFSKPKKASVAEHADGTHTLLCRPCKEDWNAAGRPSAATKAEVA